MKVLIYYIRNRKINFRLFVGTGGMPSSHSALVSCLATTIGLETSWDSPVFLLALGMALVIMEQHQRAASLDCPRAPDEATWDRVLAVNGLAMSINVDREWPLRGWTRCLPQRGRPASERRPRDHR